ncbi:MAG: phage tail sheath family protein, partial [Oceanospirillaceae bacterium]|nr:phage tail sheath family protein [Oceanospirillaceae bacterium]
MASYLHPGVYIEEIPSGSRPIEGVSTSITAYVGSCSRGPTGATLIGKFDDYVRDFGGVAGAGGASGR